MAHGISAGGDQRMYSFFFEDNGIPIRFLFGCPSY